MGRGNPYDYLLESLDIGGAMSFAYFRRTDMIVRDSQELVGICRGIIADGKVCDKEVEFLLRWLQNSEEAARAYPGNILLERLVSIFEDGVIDEQEKGELLFLLRDLIGERENGEIDRRSSSLGLNDPQPPLRFRGENFCLTGVFEYGSRGHIEAHLKSIGGTIKSSITKKNPIYLVVGTFATEEWKFSTYGRKLETAIALREEGCAVSIISEAHMFHELERLGFIAG